MICELTAKLCPLCGDKTTLQERYIQGIANKKHYRRICKACNISTDWHKSIYKADLMWKERLNKIKPCIKLKGK